ncbi:SDR family NAD(P)-dependent oxidoreductase [Trebonia sp.]|uniref:SDR family NAD(P)-dependent oxidoreductase n=1 Tax=Trebonia sp. TaxID=2767075 RepID=UPI0026307A56|nr:SDR family NAD(P)-dependent oxidoreductase [Trebonia sp.]
MNELTGRVALVTGAGRTIGRGVATALAAAGAAVAVNDLDPDSARTVAVELRAVGGPTAAAPGDVTDRESVRRMVDTAVEALGPVDVYVHAAGMPVNVEGVKFLDSDPDQWPAWIDLNLYAAMYGTHAVLGGMCDREWGRIIAISSYASRTGSHNGLSVYGAAKSGLEGFLRHVALESGPFGVTVNAVALGTMSFLRGAPADPAAAGAIPMRRLGTPEDVGNLVAFLASDRASWITGQTVHLNGGAYMT